MVSTVHKFSSSRRRTLKIIAAAGGTLASVRTALAVGTDPEVFQWRGSALGARASLTLYHVGDVEGRRLANRMTEEVQRLEQQFSLYRNDSAISQLNATGVLDHPPIDLVRLLSQAHAISEATDGSFDVTVQPLWKLYSDYFNAAGAEVSGPGPDAISAALKLVGYQGIEISSSKIRLRRPGMSLTLNGIAQGYITDRIADLLYADGLRSVLIDLGEIRALNSHPSGRPWKVGLRDPLHTDGVTETIEVRDQAVATSAGTGTLFNTRGRYHHIFNPNSGRSAATYQSVSVAGKSATVADALSTGLYNLAPDRAREVISSFTGYSAYVVHSDGRKQTWTG